MFSQTSGVQDSTLIPAGVLAYAVLIPKEVKVSTTSGAQFANVELILSSGTFEKRRIFEMIMDPFDPNASEGGKRMGILAITRICEAVGIFKPDDAESYNRYSFEGCTIQHVLEDIENQTVAIKTKIEPGKDGHADKNKVAEWLTPNQKSKSGFDGWKALADGKETLSGKPPLAPSAGSRPVFGGGTRPAPGVGARPGGPGSWLTGPNGGAPAGPTGPGDEEDDIPF